MKKASVHYVYRMDETECEEMLAPFQTNGSLFS